VSSISSTFFARFFCTNVILAAFFMYIRRKTAAETIFAQKSKQKMLMKLTPGEVWQSFVGETNCGKL